MSKLRALAPDLAGIYITDDYIDVILGRDRAISQHKRTLADLQLDANLKENRRSFHFSSRVSTESTFRTAGQWIKKQAPDLRSIGIGCYGPFETINPRDRDLPSYGRLATTSHSRMTNESIVEFVLGGLGEALQHPPKVTIETDVGAAAIGYVYNTLRSTSAKHAMEDPVVVFVKASLGIGGAVFHSSMAWNELTSGVWHGRMHPEMGQINVPRWVDSRRDKNGIEATWSTYRAMNWNSVEGLASVIAINERFSEDGGFNRLKNLPSHAAWHREAWYLAQLAWSITCMISPHYIVFGGRIVGVPGLIRKVRLAFSRRLTDRTAFPEFPRSYRVRDYLRASLARGEHGQTIVDRPGVVGALCISAMMS